MPSAPSTARSSSLISSSLKPALWATPTNASLPSTSLVVAPLAMEAVGLGEQADRLVVADRGRGDAGPPGHLANGELRRVVHSFDSGLDFKPASTPIVVADPVQPQAPRRSYDRADDTAFDIEAFRRGYEEWDIEALLGLYADDVEIVQIDRDNPPGAPRVRQGKEVLQGMFEHCAAAGVKATVENTVADGHRAAATVTCEFPGGRRVVANGIFDIENGRIVRERDVVSGDPKAA